MKRVSGLPRRPRHGRRCARRPIGETDSNGRLLVPGLRSYESNKLAIDPRNLPVDADIATTQDIVAPADRAGVRVNFWVQTNINAAVLVLGRRMESPSRQGCMEKLRAVRPSSWDMTGAPTSRCSGARTPSSWRWKMALGRASFTYTDKANQQVVIQVICR
jgi:outer membrane usher protein